MFFFWNLSNYFIIQLSKYKFNENMFIYSHRLFIIINNTYKNILILGTQKGKILHWLNIFF